MLVYFSGGKININHMNGNSKRPTNVHKIPSTSAQHNDIIDYIFESWRKVSIEMDRNTSNIVVYSHDQGQQNLKDFQPFDLEKFFYQRFVYNFQRS